MNAANTETSPTFAVKFSLTVTVEGTSLQDIDNGLVQAAGQRLAARMQNPPRLNGVDVLSGSNAREEPRAPVSIVAGAHAGAELPGAGGGGSPFTGANIGAGTAAAGGFADAGSAEPAAPRGKRGVKPGSVRGPYKKTVAEEAADAAAAQIASSAAPSAGAPSAGAPSAGAPQAAPPVQVAPPAAPQAPVAQAVTPPAAQGQVPTLDQCVAALTAVNKAKNTDIAYKCLTDMGVKRCGEIPEARRAEFIAKCEATAAGA